MGNDASELWRNVHFAGKEKSDEPDEKPISHQLLPWFLRHNEPESVNAFVEL